MTPKEKAIELIDKFNNHTVKELVYLKNGKVIEGKTEAKECALIALDELIKYHDDLMDVVRYELPSNIVAVIPYKYWEDVKKEIEKL